jgi:hypothetical protein
MTKSKKWIVSTSGDHSLRDVQKQLTDTGFTVEQVLDQIGIIIGSASDEVAARLRTIPGVADVSPDTDVGFPPAKEPGIV